MNDKLFTRNGNINRKKKEITSKVPANQKLYRLGRNEPNKCFHPALPRGGRTDSLFMNNAVIGGSLNAAILSHLNKPNQLNQHP